MSMVRALMFGIAAAGVFFAPWWVPLSLALLIMVRFAAWEMVALMALLDALYLPHDALWYIPFPATGAALLALAVCAPLRRRLLVRD